MRLAAGALVQVFIGCADLLFGFCRQRLRRPRPLVKLIVLVPKIHSTIANDLTHLRSECAHLKINDQLPLQSASASLKQHQPTLHVEFKQTVVEQLQPTAI